MAPASRRISLRSRASIFCSRAQSMPLYSCSELDNQIIRINRFDTPLKKHIVDCYTCQW